MLALSLSFATAQTPALAIGSIAQRGPTITSLSYQITIPPATNSSVGFEFHAGMLSGDNSTFIKGTISYGCQVSAHKACFPTFKNRYIFYVSVIDSKSLYRTQYPSMGYVVTPGSNYTIVFTKTHCLFNMQAWSFSIANSTDSFSTKVCMLNQNFVYPVAGMLELHNVTDCGAQLPSSHSFTQRNFTTNNGPVTSWSLIQTEPYINCNFTNSYSGNDISIGWS